MNWNNRYILIILILVLTQSSCGKIEQLSEVPRIEFTGFTVFDTTDILGNQSKAGCLDFYFEDGDGNIGLAAPEDGETDTTNLFLSVFVKEGDDFIEITDPSNGLKPSEYRIPYMEKTGQNKIMRGDISLRFIYTFYGESDSTTIKYDFRLKDRDNNYSNFATTCEIPLSVNGYYIMEESETETDQ